jgi:hypothetical protein
MCYSGHAYEVKVTHPQNCLPEVLSENKLRFGPTGARLRYNNVHIAGLPAINLDRRNPKLKRCPGQPITGLRDRWYMRCL